MTYTEKEVISILKEVTDIDPNEIIEKWNIEKSNTLLDLTEYDYPLFCYSFPLVINGEKVAKVSILDTHGTGTKYENQNLASKYLGYDGYIKSWSDFSHNSYKWCYLTIYKEFKLEHHENDKNFFVFESSFLDSDNKEIKYTLSYGYPEKSYLYEKYTSTYGFYTYTFDNGVNIQIEKTDISGWLLGETINKNINERKNKT